MKEYFSPDNFKEVMAKLQGISLSELQKDRGPEAFYVALLCLEETTRRDLLQGCGYDFSDVANLQMVAQYKIREFDLKDGV